MAPISRGSDKEENMAQVTGKRIGVLMGGLSSERDVSLASGGAILQALLSRGYDAVGIDVGRDLAERLHAERIEIAFNGLHGKYGEDGAVQGLLEMLGIPCTGSGILASAMGMNKIVSKTIFRAYGLNVGAFEVVNRGDAGALDAACDAVGFPLVIKPSCEGSSVGVSIVRDSGAFGAAADLAFSYDREILVEQYIAGMEIQVGVLGERALGAIEIVPKDTFYSYKAKYEAGGSDHFFPARVPKDLYQRTLDAGLLAHRALGCRGYSRVDFIMNGDGIPYILEVNTLPGMTATSLLPEIARGAGFSFPDLVEEILRLALEER
jgi:D-alanine-D-alanine ligase